MEQRYRSITYRGHDVTLVDLTNLDNEKEIIRLLRTRTGDEKPHGLLVDVTNAHISPTSLAVAKGDAKQVQSFIKATAVVGSGSMVGMMVRAVSRFSGMNIRTFDTRQAAMEWLASEVTKT